VGIRSYRDLIAWQRAMDLVEGVYRVTHSFPKDELYGLTSQLRRAAVSVPSNIAEGQGRGTVGEFIHYLRIAHGSLCETETQILIAQRLSYLNSQQVRALLDLAREVGRLINGLLTSLK
jgi:four helix bundle protein